MDGRDFSFAPEETSGDAGGLTVMPLAFTLRKLFAPVLFPLSLGLELLVLGVVLLWFTRRQRAAKVAVTAGTVLLAAMSFNMPAAWLLTSLEGCYLPRLEQEKTIDARARWIVVLGGGFTPDSRLPVTSQLGPSTLARLVEGVRLYKQFPGTRLVASGGADFNSGPEAGPLAEVAELLGVAAGDIVLESESLDTEDQARRVASIVGKDHFFLVTSAFHMPRAVALFKKLGLQPLPSPADYEIKRSRETGVAPQSFQPHADNFKRTEKAAYEYLGLAWARLRGAI